MQIATDAQNHQEKFIEFHKKKKSYWLLVSIFVLFAALIAFVYAFQTQSKYRKIILDSSNKTENKFITEQRENDVHFEMSEDVRNTQLFFQNEKLIFRKFPLDAPPEQILLADVYAVSSDGNKIAFYQGEMGDDKGYFAVLDLKSKQETEYKLKEYETLRGIEWSPDDQFILINYGTSMYGSTTVFDLEKNSESGFFGQYSNIIWIDGERLYTAQMARNIRNRFVESGYGSDVVEISIKNPRSPKIVASADLTNDYYPISIVDDCLVVRIDSVQNENDWESPDRETKVKKNFACYNIKTGDKNLIPFNYETSGEELLINEIKKELQLDDNKLAYIQILAADFENNYKIANVNKGGSIYGSEIFLIDPNKVSESMFLLGQGAHMYWRKL